MSDMPAPSRPRPTIIPTWMWDELEKRDVDWFRQLRDAGQIVRVQST